MFGELNIPTIHIPNEALLASHSRHAMWSKPGASYSLKTLELIPHISMKEHHRGKRELTLRTYMNSKVMACLEASINKIQHQPESCGTAISSVNTLQ